MREYRAKEIIDGIEYHFVFQHQDKFILEAYVDGEKMDETIYTIHPQCNSFFDEYGNSLDLEGWTSERLYRHAFTEIFGYDSMPPTYEFFNVFVHIMEQIDEWDQLVINNYFQGRSKNKEWNENLRNYSDNYRLAIVGNKTQEVDYQKQIDKGCCGNMDIIYKSSHTDIEYMLGFNFGH